MWAGERDKRIGEGDGRRGRICANAYHPIRRSIRLLALLLRIIRALAAQPPADNLDPVPIRIKREGDVLHAAVAQSLLEAVAGVLEAAARGLDVVDGDAHVAEAAMRLRIPIIHLVVGVVLRPVVVRQLDEPLPVERAVALRQSARPVVPQEVQVELGLGELQVLDQAHAEELVELD